ncbi:hypothetical protein GCM10022230_05770 [Pseudoclavibacter caeni]
MATMRERRVAHVIVGGPARSSAGYIFAHSSDTGEGRVRRQRRADGEGTVMRCRAGSRPMAEQRFVKFEIPL